MVMRCDGFERKERLYSKSYFDSGYGFVLALALIFEWLHID